MKRELSAILLLSILLPLTAQPGKRIVILHTNDMHSRLTGYGPELLYTPLTINDDKTVGGFARIAAIIKEEKEMNSGTTLVLDAGDFTMGTLFQALEPETGFQLWLMRKAGYDVVCAGNHEFDYGPAKLAEILTSASGRGEIPPVLLSNGVFDTKDPGDDALEKLANTGAIKRKYIIERDGLKIGFFSLMGKVADDNAAYAVPVTFSKQIPLAKKMVKELRDEKCDLVICLSHSGVDRGKNGGWTGEDIKLADKVKGIDVIVSGHTHTKLEKPIMVKGIPIIQAGENGEFIGKLSLSWNNGKVNIEDYILLPVNDKIKGDPVVNQLVENQKKLVNSKVLEPLGLDYETKVAEIDFLLECVENGDIKGSNLGPMVADAIHQYVNSHVKTGTDISMVAVGVIREKLLPGAETAPDIFRVMSMGNGRDNMPGYPLARLYVTGKELKSILEILQVAYKSTPANYCYYSGLRVAYNPDKGMLRKISKIDIIRPDGSVKNVDFSKKNHELYSVTANSYMLEFFGIIKKMSFGLINVVPKDGEGQPVTDMKAAVIDFDPVMEGVQEGKEWLALLEYLRSMKDTNGNGVPDINNKYRSAIQSFIISVESR